MAGLGYWYPDGFSVTGGKYVTTGAGLVVVTGRGGTVNGLSGTG